jgi:hypothetical protein
MQVLTKILKKLIGTLVSESANQNQHFFKKICLVPYCLLNRPTINGLKIHIQSMNAIGNVTRTASRIYLEIIGIQMKSENKSGPTTDPYGKPTLT